jgi:hypothetical protein
MLLFDHRLVEAAEAGVTNIQPILEAIFGEDTPYSGGWRDIQIKWIPVGSRFQVREYDGSESLHILDQMQFYTA